MESNDINSHIEDIETKYSRLFRPNEEIMRYYGAVYRYLLGTVRNPAVALELAHEFAERFLRGDFQRFNPAKGRFRDFLKVSLRHLAIDYWRKLEKAKGMEALPMEVPEKRQPELPELDDCCREDLLARAWKALALAQEKTGKPYHAVLTFKIQHPDMRSPEIAEQLGRELGKELSAVGLRMLLHRARTLFAELLLAELRKQLATADPARVEDELIELKLLEYCKPALKAK